MNLSIKLKLASAIAAVSAALLPGQAQVSLPEAWALPTSAGVDPGFLVRVVQANNNSGTLPNTLARTEAHLAGLIIDPKTKVPYVNDVDNVAWTFDANGYYYESKTIAYEQGGGGANGSIPGIPGKDSMTDNISMEVLTWLKLTAGDYTFVVNSDDGFEVRAGANAKDALSSIVLGRYDGGRGASDSSFKFKVTKDGLYSFRLIWEEGGGGANVSWYNAVGGDVANQVLINETGGIPAFRNISGSVSPSVTYASPGKDAIGASPSGGISLLIADGLPNTVDSASVKLSVDGTAVTPTVTKTGSTTTVAYIPPALFDPLSNHKAAVTYKDSGGTTYTSEWSFTVAKYTNVKLPAPVVFENFNSTDEGKLPAGWTEVNFTTGATGEFDLLNPNSDYYLGWVVISEETVNAASWDAARRLQPGESYVNGKRVEKLVDGKFAYAESDNRGGSQVQYLFSPDFDMTGKKSLYVAYNSIYEQNQDSIGSVEYSIDQGKSWQPIVYMIDGPDIVVGADGKVDAVATFTKENGDTASLTDPNTGEEIGKKYGAFIGATISQDLASFIEARVNDDPIESKRVEFRRIVGADGQKTVRFRFAQAGTGSWYFGIDNFGVYEVTQVDPPKIDVQPVATTAYEGFPLKLSVGASGVGLRYQWTLNGNPISGATNATYVVAMAAAANAGNYAVTVLNEGGSASSSTVAVAIRPVPTSFAVNDALAAYFKFDGDLSDASGNNRNGEAVGAPGSVDGKLGKALEYTSLKDGSSFNFVKVGGTPIDFSTTDFTVAFWAKLSTWEGDPAFISNKNWNSGGNQGFVVATAGDGRIQWNIADQSRTRKDFDSAGGKFNDNAWHHVTVVFARSGNTVTYFDGIEIDSRSIAGLGNTGTPADLALNIGQDGTGSYTDGGGVGVDKGQIDDVAIWTRTLSAGEVATIVVGGNNGKALSALVPPPVDLAKGLALHLPFDGSYADNSGNGRNGTAVGTPSLTDGKVGQALKYSSLKDGTSFNYVTVGGSPIDLSTSDFSVAFWAKIGKWTGDPAFIANKDWNSGGNQGFVVATAGDGRIQWNIADQTRTRKDYDSPGGKFNDGGWHSVVVTFTRAGNAVTYFDGVEIDSRSISGLGNTGTPAGLALNIGQDGKGIYTDGGSVGIEQGHIDEVAVWTRTLTVDEVNAVYTKGSTGQPIIPVVKVDPLTTALVKPTAVLPVALPEGSVKFGVAGSMTIAGPGLVAWPAASNADQPGDVQEFAYEQLTGDFDISTKVSSVTSGPQTDPVDAWASGGLQARESLNALSPSFLVNVGNPKGVNEIRTIGRATAAQNYTSFGRSYGGVDKTLPSQWIRLRRVGNWFAGYVSTDGTSWALIGQRWQEWPEKLLVGAYAFSASYNSADQTGGKNLATVEFSNYGKTVLADTGAPTLVSVGTIDSKTVGVKFSEPVASATALVAGNYKLSQGTVTGVSGGIGGDTVYLSVSGLTADSFDVTVNNVTDTSGNKIAAASKASGKKSDWKSTDIGLIQSRDPAVRTAGDDPYRKGQAVAVSSGATETEIEIIGGGSNAWNPGDYIHYLSGPTLTGDFEVSVEVSRNDRPANTAAWANSGLMLRESEYVAGSEYTQDGTKVAMVANTTYIEGSAPNRAGIPLFREEPGAGYGNGNPGFAWTTPIGGIKGYYLDQRAVDAAGTPDPESSALSSRWLRIKRAGNDFTFFVSYDGREWALLDGPKTLPLNNGLIFGFSTMSDTGSGAPPNNGYGGNGFLGTDLEGQQNPSNYSVQRIRIGTSVAPRGGATPTVSIQGSTVTFTGKLQEASSLSGTFTDVPGATSPYTIPLGSQVRFYRSSN